MIEEDKKFIKKKKRENKMFGMWYFKNKIKSINQVRKFSYYLFISYTYL